MKVWTRRLGIAAIGLSVGWGSIGCASEAEPINRVQPEALKKSFFVGDSLSDPSDDPEFYYRSTLVDVPYGLSGGDYKSSILFTPAAADTNRIKWEIQENWLVARQTYERFENADGHGSRRTNDGQVVAAFEIEAHYDIKRAYNPATGAENNVIQENVTDRPWYEREFMRVRWGTNKVANYTLDTLQLGGIIGAVGYEPIDYHTEDPNDPQAPHFDAEDGYFDVTNHVFAKPATLDFEWGSIPACYALFSYAQWFNPATNCNPTELTIRNSFHKVVDRDFEPTDWDGNRAQAFGWITTDRMGFERNYGLTDTKWHHLAMKYNIWEKSHIEGSQCGIDYWRDDLGNIQKYKVDGSGKFLTDSKTGLPIPDENGKPFQSTPIGADPKRDDNGNKTDDECEFKDAGGNLLHAGAYCDTISQKCSLPAYERKIKTQAWYHSETAPEDLFASSAEALDQWSVSIKQAAQLAKVAEAKRVGKDVNELTSEEDLKNDAGKTVPDVFVLCHNPPREGTDKPACFKTRADGTKVAPTVRLGDLRYNIVNLIQNPQMPSAWGVVFPSMDPLTGEAIGTTVTEWLYITDSASRRATDIIRWSNGEIGDDQIINASFMKEWVQSSQLGTKPYKPATLSNKEVNSRLASVDPNLGLDNGLTAEELKLPISVRNKKAARNLAALGPSVDRDFEANRQQLMNTKFEHEAITREMLSAAGMPIKPSENLPPLDSKVLAQASPLRMMDPEVMHSITRTTEKMLGAKGACIVQAGQFDSMVGLAREAARLYPLPNSKADADSVCPYDPNLKESTDYPACAQKRNEKIRMWLRERYHVAVIAHEMGHHMGLEHNFSGSFDALNYHTEYWQLRTRNGAEKPCTDMKKANDRGETCVGPRWVDPVSDTEENGLIWKWGTSSIMDYPGDQTQDTNGIGSYDKAAMRFGYGNVVDVDVDANVNNDKGKAYLEVLDGFGGPTGYMVGGVHYSRYQDKYNPLGSCSGGSDTDPLSGKCTGFQMDHVSIRDMQPHAKASPDLVQADSTMLAHFAVDPQGRVRHPYMFGTDTYADETNSTVFRFDAGADAYEQVSYLAGYYEHYYPFTHFRMNRVTFSDSAAEGSSMRSLRPIKGIIKAFGLQAQLSPPADREDPAKLMPFAMAGSEALAFMGRVLTRPEPGPYILREGKTYASRADLNEELQFPAGDFVIPTGSGDGRFVHDDYDYTQGYMWGDYLLQAGSFVDKYYAFFFLVEAHDNFTFDAKDTYVDGRYRNVNFLTLYPNQVRRLFANMMQNDPHTLGPYTKVGSKLGEVSHVTYLPWEKYDISDSTTTSLEYPSDATILSPLVGWEQQKLGLLILFIYGAGTKSMDLVDQMRIFTPGGTETVDIPIGEQLHYRDPFTGILYVTRSGGQEVVNSKMGKTEKYIGARMLQYANGLAGKSYKTTGKTANGEWIYEKDASGELICIDPSHSCALTKQTLTSFSANLDLTRELAQFRYGPHGW